MEPTSTTDSDCTSDPVKLKGKELEKLCIYRMQQEEVRGVATMSRYGVQTSMVDEKWIPIRSLPDFEGIMFGGRQFVIEVKVCSAASFPLDDDKFKARQLKHLMTRGRFGAVSMLLIHFNGRVLAKKTEPAITWALPVYPEHDFWREFDRGEVKRIARSDCEQYGHEVPWTVFAGCRKESPDLVGAVKALSERFKGAPVRGNHHELQRAASHGAAEEILPDR